MKNYKLYVPFLESQSPIIYFLAYSRTHLKLEISESVQQTEHIQGKPLFRLEPMYIRPSLVPNQPNRLPRLKCLLSPKYVLVFCYISLLKHINI